MRPETQKYLAIETLSSFVVNGVLNFLPAYAIFRHRPLINMDGRNGMFQDSLGETLIVTFLSYLVPALIGRSRRKAGTLPLSGLEGRPVGNVYLRALVVAVLFTLILAAINAAMLPRIFGDLVSLRTEVIFKTFYGAVIGAIASSIAVRQSLHEGTPTAHSGVQT